MWQRQNRLFQRGEQAERSERSQPAESDASKQAGEAAVFAKPTGGTAIRPRPKSNLVCFWQRNEQARVN
jgi:hypothetical protein